MEKVELFTSIALSLWDHFKFGCVSAVSLEGTPWFCYLSFLHPYSPLYLVGGTVGAVILPAQGTVLLLPEHNFLHSPTMKHSPHDLI